jgi:predicted transglutaminase-like cysteine proteinase
MVKVNNWVNYHIKPVSDLEHWGVVDQWDFPSAARSSPGH